MKRALKTITALGLFGVLTVGCRGPYSPKEAFDKSSSGTLAIPPVVLPDSAPFEFSGIQAFRVDEKIYQDRVVLHWDPLPGQLVRFFRGSTKNGKYDPLKDKIDGAVGSWEDQSVKPNTSYYYKMEVYRQIDQNTVVTGGMSLPVKGYAAVLGAPVFRWALGMNQSIIQMCWRTVFRADGYELYRFEDNDDNRDIIAGFNQKNPEFPGEEVLAGAAVDYQLALDSGSSLIVRNSNKEFKINTWYYYIVRAVRNDGTDKGPFSLGKGYTVSQDNAPGTPVMTSVPGASQTHFSVSWVDPEIQVPVKDGAGNIVGYDTVQTDLFGDSPKLEEDGSGKTIAHYKVLWADNEDGPYHFVLEDPEDPESEPRKFRADERECSEEAPEGERSRFYKVIAYNDMRNMSSLPKDPVKSSILYAPATFVVNSISGENGVKLTFEKVLSEFAPGERTRVSYRFYRYAGDADDDDLPVEADRLPRDVPESDLTPEGDGAYSWVDDSLEPGKAWSYRIRAVNEDSVVSGDFSPLGRGFTTPTPGAFTATEGTVVDKIRLSWTSRGSEEEIRLYFFPPGADPSGTPQMKTLPGTDGTDLSDFNYGLFKMNLAAYDSWGGESPKTVQVEGFRGMSDKQFLQEVYKMFIRPWAANGVNNSFNSGSSCEGLVDGDMLFTCEKFHVFSYYQYTGFQDQLWMSLTGAMEHDTKAEISTRGLLNGKLNIGETYKGSVEWKNVDISGSRAQSGTYVVHQEGRSPVEISATDDYCKGWGYW